MEKNIPETSKVSEYVVMGAMTSCTMGATPCMLNLIKSHGVFLKNKPQLNIGDRRVGENIICYGTCSKSSPPPPCTPSIVSDWINNQKTNLILEDKEALIQDANVFCALGGKISIDQSGQ